MRHNRPRTRVGDTLVITLAIAVATSATACRKRSQSQPQDNARQLPVVVSIDDEDLTVRDLIAPAALRAASVQPMSEDARNEMIEKAVQFEVLAKEARDRGYDRNPEVMRAAKQEMVARLLNDDVQVTGTDVPDAQIQQYYASHLEEFKRPARLHLRGIAVNSVARAHEMFAAAKALPPVGADGFRELARRYAEDEPSRQSGGDLGFIDAKNSDLPRQLIDTAFATPDNAVAGPVKTDRGFYVLRVTEKTPGRDLDLDQVRDQIRERLASSLKAKKIEAWTATIRGKHRVEIRRDRLKDLDL